MQFNILAKFAALAVLLSNAGPAAAAPAESMPFLPIPHPMYDV